MIRFRFTEDEKRYLTLVGEVYRLLAQHLPAPAVSQAMRNMGKLQDMLMMEGVRQGLAVAEVSELSGHGRALKAFQAHAAVYGDADTPLREVEIALLQQLGLDDSTASSTWLDNGPMRFAPQTLTAYQAERASPAPPPEPDNLPPVAAFPPPTPGLDQEDAQERPALLDQVRDALQSLVDAGYKPGDWSEMIMRLHLILKVDAGFLDLQLGTEMGRTVLTQCGIFVDPGRGIDLNEMQKLLDSPETLSGGSTEP